MQVFDLHRQKRAGTYCMCDPVSNDFLLMEQLCIGDLIVKAESDRGEEVW